MVEKTVEVTNETGLHARPASVFVEKAENFAADIKVIKGDNEADAKSIMGVMSLGVDQGTEITIQAEGDAADEAVDALVELIKDDFGE